MRRFAILTTWLLGMLLGMAATAAAQSAEIGISVGRSNFSGRDIGTITGFETGQTAVTLDNGIRIGARLALNTGYFFGHEVSYAYQDSGLRFDGGPSDGMTIQNFYYNFVVHATPEGSAVRPFGTGGVGVSVFFPPGLSSFSGGGENKFGVNYGGGLKFKLNEIFGFRVDVRDHVTGKPFDLAGATGRLHNVEYSATFSVLF